MSFNTQNTWCGISFNSQFEEQLLPKIKRTVIQLHLLQHFMASVLEMNKVIMENYAEKFCHDLLNKLSVQNTFKVKISCANWLIKLTSHGNNWTKKTSGNLKAFFLYRCIFSQQECYCCIDCVTENSS